MLEADPFEKKMFIDPPSGWRYGFPKPLPENWKDDDFDLKQWLLDNEYPKEEVEFGIHHCRYFLGTIYG